MLRVWLSITALESQYTITQWELWRVQKFRRCRSVQRPPEGYPPSVGQNTIWVQFGQAGGATGAGTRVGCGRPERQPERGNDCGLRSLEGEPRACSEGGPGTGTDATHVHSPTSRTCTRRRAGAPPCSTERHPTPQRAVPDCSQEGIASGALGHVSKAEIAWNYHSPRWRGRPEVKQIREEHTDWRRWLATKPYRPFDPCLY